MRRDENPYSTTSSKVIKTIPPEDFPDGPVVKNPLANAGDTGSIPGLERFHMPRNPYAAFH